MYDFIITDLDTDSKTIFQKVDMNFILIYLKKLEGKLENNKKTGTAVKGRSKNSRTVKTNAK